MIKKSINLLKSNSSILIFYAAFYAITLLILFLLYPRNLNSFININTFYPFVYMIAILKICVAMVLIYGLSITFISGFGLMIKEAVITGKTSTSSFLPGLKKYFVRILLMSLLLFAFAIGFSFAISIITIPIMLTQMVNVGFENLQNFQNTQNFQNLKNMSLSISLFTTSLTIIAIPFIILWLPSIFIDDVKIIQGLKNGVKAGVKNYWKLLVYLVIIYIPIMIYQIFSFDTMMNGVIFTPGYIAILILEACLSIVILPIFYMIYNDNKTGR